MMKKKIPGGSGDPPRREGVVEETGNLPRRESPPISPRKRGDEKGVSSCKYLSSVLPETPEHVEPAVAREQLLDKLLKLALDESDVRAAKLYLDYAFKSNAETKTGLSLEEALRMMQTSSTEPTADDDDYN